MSEIKKEMLISISSDKEVEHEVNLQGSPESLVHALTFVAEEAKGFKSVLIVATAVVLFNEGQEDLFYSILGKLPEEYVSEILTKIAALEKEYE